MTVVIVDVFWTSRVGWVGGRFVARAVSSSFTEGSRVCGTKYIYFLRYNLFYF